MSERNFKYDYATRDEEVYSLMSRVSESFSVKNEDLIEHSRKGHHVLARGVFCYLAKKHLSMGPTEIGRYLNRDHSSIMYLIDKTESLLEVREVRIFRIVTAIENFLTNNKYEQDHAQKS